VGRLSGTATELCCIDHPTGRANQIVFAVCRAHDGERDHFLGAEINSFSPFIDGR
jgi:hypothetical protein